MASKKSDVLNTIQNKIPPLGFKEVQTNSHGFSTAYIRNGIITSRVFLINDSESIESHNLPKVISNAYIWCQQYLRSKWILKESGLNLILIHKGTLTHNDIDGFTAKTGFDKAVVKSGAILQSITAINTLNLLVCQSKTWVVTGKVKKALEMLQKFP